MSSHTETDLPGSLYSFTFACLRKSYGSQLSYESHLRSKKHKEGGKREDTFPQHDSTTGELMEAGNIDHQNAASRCLFCDEQQYDFDANLRHMSRYHGFFLPDAEYLSDVEGLVNYLSNKIRCGHTCLYCSKGFKSSQATMAHMVSDQSTAGKKRLIYPMLCVSVDG